MKEISKEKSAAEYDDIKNLLEYLINKQNKALQDSMEINNAELQDNLRTEIEMSSRRSKMESERLLRELLECPIE
jgi:hypothetical protein